MRKWFGAEKVLQAAAGERQLIAQSSEGAYLQAEETDEGPVTVAGVAYTGGQLAVSAWGYPVVIDLTGMKIEDQVRLDVDHSSRVIDKLGEVAASVGSGQISYDGQMIRKGPTAEHVLAHNEVGSKWDVSIDARVQSDYFVEPGETVELNGQTHEGPVMVAERSRLVAISIVTKGAEPESTLDIAAQAAEEDAMTFEKWLEARGFAREELSDAQEKALKAAYDADQDAGEDPEEDPEELSVQARTPEVEEIAAATERHQRERAAAVEAELDEVRAVCAEYKDKVDGEKLSELKAQAIKGEISKAELELGLIRAKRPASGVNIQTGGDHAPGEKVIECSLAQATGVAEKSLEDDYEEPVLEAARDEVHGGYGLQAAIMDLAHMGGYQQRRFRPNDLGDILQAAFSTMGATEIFNNVANKNILQAFMAVEQVWREVSATRSVSDFKQTEHTRLAHSGEFEEIGPHGELTHGTVSDDKYTNQAKTYGRMFAISRTDIINDDGGAFNDITRMIGRNGAKALNTLFWAMVDAMTFDVATETGSDLTYDNLSAARSAFVNQTDDEDHPLGLRPQILLVHDSLDIDARRLMNPTNLIDGTTTTEVPNRHPLQGAYTVRSSVYLSQVGGELPWRLLANPADLPAYLVSFLNGREEPTVEQSAVDFNQLGVQFRGYFDFGVDEAETEAGVIYTETV